MRRITIKLFCWAILLVVLSGCGTTPKVPASTVAKPNVASTNATANIANDYRLISELTDGWKIILSGENKGQIIKDGEPVGLIEIVGNYEGTTGLPNHSSIIRSENIVSELGNGKLYILDRSMPAASPDQKTWTEIYTLVPINEQNLAFSIWVDTNEASLKNDVIAMKSMLQKLALK